MMQITKELIESLLWEEEGPTLDFKQKQYPFANATDEQKSELLKDILAFTNAFRRNDAFILLGVKDVKGARSEVVGVSEQIDDAHLQQLVNGKTQRPVNFAYKAAEHDGFPIGIIHIPLQFRPVYAKAKFGKVEKGAVYVRRGSSTAVASPEEIAQMGADRAAVPAAAPSLELMLIDRETGKPIAMPATFQTLLLDVPAKEEVPDYHDGRNDPLIIRIHHGNADYYRELAAFTRTVNFLRPVFFTVRNTGEVSAQDVRLVFEIDDPSLAWEFVEAWDIPEPPKTHYDPLHGHTIRTFHETQDISVERVGDTWRVEGRFGKIQPQQTAQLKDALFVGAAKSDALTINAQIFADNLPRPRPARFELEFAVERTSVALDEIEAMERQRFFATPEGAALLDEIGQKAEE